MRHQRAKPEWIGSGRSSEIDVLSPSIGNYTFNITMIQELHIEYTYSIWLFMLPTRSNNKYGALNHEHALVTNTYIPLYTEEALGPYFLCYQSIGSGWTFTLSTVLYAQGPFTFGDIPLAFTAIGTAAGSYKYSHLSSIGYNSSIVGMAAPASIGSNSNRFFPFQFLFCGCERHRLPGTECVC